MTPALSAALGAHYRKAIINSMPGEAVTALADTLRGDDTLIADAQAEQTSLNAFAKAMGGIDRLRQRDFAAATHLQGLTQALAQL